MKSLIKLQFQNCLKDKKSFFILIILTNKEAMHEVRQNYKKVTKK